MKRILPFLIAITSVGLMYFTMGPSQKNSDETEKFIDELISKMTLEEKVGQMTQITLEVVTVEGNERDPKKPLTIDKDKLREAIVDYKVGSIINTGGAANTLEDWQKIITDVQDVATKETKLGIPILYGIDAIHGVNYTIGATMFPQNIAMAATRNRDLLRKSAEITSHEMKACGIPWNFNPVLGLGRQPYWPRFWETFGEDPYLASEFAVEYVEGMQGDDMSAPTKAASCVKHYIGYSVPVNGKDRTPAWIPDRMLRDIFLPPFAAGIKAGSPTVMVNSSEINGIPAHSDHKILTEILKEELKFDGFIVSDWEDIKRLHDRDRVAETPKEAVKMAVMAGMDMSMVPYDYSFAIHLKELVEEGEVPVSRVDDAVRRILRVKHQLGLFDNPYPIKELAKDFANEEFTNINKNAAREAVTLLKNNDGILPVSKDSKILVTGPTANKMMSLNGGWTLTWQGNNEELYPKDKNTFFEAVQQIVGKENVTYVEGTAIDKDINTSEAVNAASNADFVFACLGEDPYCETPGNIDDLTLENAQLNLVEELSKTGKPIILVLFEGRPRVINSIVDKVDGIVLGYLPGMEGGDATAEVIFGDVNPSGKLPFSYPKAPNGFTCYDHKPIEKFDVNDYDPQWPFGYGLSYTTFEYSDLKVNDTYKMDDKIKVAVKVKNDGKIAGKESVEIFITDVYGSVTRPMRQLKGFQKIHLEPAEEKVVEFEFSSKDFAFHNRENELVTEPGEFKVTVKELTKSFNIN
jgi:beta-glucosidase